MPFYLVTSGFKKMIRLFFLIAFSLFLCTLQAQPVNSQKTKASSTSEIAFEKVNRPSPLKGKAKGTAVQKIERSFRRIFELYKNKVVFISTEKNVRKPSNPFANDPFFQKFFGQPGRKKRSKKKTGLGTGFILSPDGYICTNYHVVAKVDKVRVRVEDTEYSARVIGTDTVTDLALLKVENAVDFEPVYFGDSEGVGVGDWAIAIGNPFGFDRTFTVGVVSAVRNQSELGGSYIQTDASINQGNSGGPLLNIDGEVIGVNRMIYAKSGGGSLGIGFSIPINLAKNVIQQLYHYGKAKWGYIGVRLAKLTYRIARQLGAKNKSGALILGVIPGAPAAKAQIKRGDIILRVANKLIKSPNELIYVINRTTIGTEIELEVWRNQEKILVPIIIGERPTK